MYAKVTAKPLGEVVEAIQALDLESVKTRLMDAEAGKGWTHEYALQIESAYKTYLTMLVKYQDDAEDILLSKDVDEFWHTHILQTAKYADDCDRVFGRFVHHNPHLGAHTAAVQQKRSAAAEKTRRIYEREFGDMAKATAAWSGVAGMPRHPEEAALSSYEIAGNRAALSSYDIKARNSALSSYEIKPGKAALSSYAIQAEKAALSSYDIRSDKAALSSYEIKAEAAALSSYDIDAKAAALSSYDIGTKTAALSSYDIGAKTAALSSYDIGETSSALSSYDAHSSGLASE